MTEARETPEPLTLRGALERIAQGSYVAGECVWCMTDFGHEPGCPVDIAGAALRAATPDPDGLRERIEALTTYRYILPLDDEATPTRRHQPFDMLRRSDVLRAIRAATPDPAEPGLREAAQAVLDHAQPQTGQAPLVPWALLDDLRAALSDTTEGQS
jgi:hypothetical protein